MLLKSVTDEEFASIFTPLPDDKHLRSLQGVPPVKKMTIHPQELFFEDQPARRLDVEFDSNETTNCLIRVDAAAPQFMPPPVEACEAAVPAESSLSETQAPPTPIQVSSIEPQAFPVQRQPALVRKIQYFSYVIKVEDSLEPDGPPSEDGSRLFRRIHALSVVRIRRLKMNKKKFKKLQRRLKLEKRKLERK